MAQIVCENLSFGHDGKVIVRDLNFSVEPGDYLCIVGENGVGKSTLMQVLLHLQTPLSGSVTFFQLKQSEIGYIAQQTEIKNDFPATVQEIVRSGCRGEKPFPLRIGKKEKELACQMMEKMEILAIKDECFSHLSGGQKKRVLLARALCATKKVLLLDEPTAGLDLEAQKIMYRLIDAQNKNDRITIVMITHDIPTALKQADYILYLGEKNFFGTTKEYEKSGLEKNFVPVNGKGE